MALGSVIGRCVDATSESRQCWRTPKGFFLQLHEIFSFTVDACASDQNHLCPVYWTKENSCLKHSWKEHTVFCNPPFGETGKILRKAPKAKTACFLLPLTCLTTRYFAQNCPRLVAIPAFRVPFTPPIGMEMASCPSLGTVILIYGEVTDNQIIKLREMELNVFDKVRFEPVELF